MRQLAWLYFYRGKLCLVTCNFHDAVRQWRDEKSALSYLADEGWDISRPYPKRLPSNQQPRHIFYGYALTRTIH
jgi:hypothetical protein